MKLTRHTGRSGKNPEDAHASGDEAGRQGADQGKARESIKDKIAKAKVSADRKNRERWEREGRIALAKNRIWSYEASDFYEKRTPFCFVWR